MNINSKTLGELKASNYTPKTIKNELRNNLIKALQEDQTPFQGVIGYEHTVIPQIERAILAGHSINFLGLRGQAKTMMARLMVNLLDEYIPIVQGSEINDDPLQPLSPYAKNLIEKQGDNTPITWVHRSKRYAEKLATPDVNVADLIGDIDPIKAANLKLSFSDEGVIHYGMIPRANRCIFVINELPDLQPRIQVALFNILQEGDIQIRGFQLRLPLDVQFVFTANPEDYTNRGSIITPLKDRIQSQIFTHYPDNIEIGSAITESQVSLTDWQSNNVQIPETISRLIEQIAVEARESEYVDEKSGVSARLPIAAYESVVSAVERRVLLNGEENGSARIGDLIATLPAIVGKIEMVYEGEQEGATNVAYHLINKAIRSLSSESFPNIEALSEKRSDEIRERFGKITQWFEQGNTLNLMSDASEEIYRKMLDKVTHLRKTVQLFDPSNDPQQEYLLMEYLIHALSSFSLLDKKRLGANFSFSDYFTTVMGGMQFE